LKNHSLLRVVGRTPVARAALVEYSPDTCQRQPEFRVEDVMAWTTPTLVEICIGLEINGYLPAEF
jgi:coenzyme PQQ precursor peptide PqqA